MSNINAKELGRQLAKPSGPDGITISNQMNVSNRGLYELTFGLLSIENNSTILEIGFGNGNHLTDYFKKNRFIRLYGLDFSETMVSMAKESNKTLISDGLLEIVCQDAKSMSFKNGTFDSVVSINTLYFWENLHQCLVEIRRVLKTGGKLYLGFRPKCQMVHLDFTKDIFTLYESEDLIEPLKHAGFHVCKIEQKDVERISIDGTPVKTIDICIVSEKLR